MGKDKKTNTVKPLCGDATDGQTWLAWFPCYTSHLNRIGVSLAHQQYLQCLFHYIGPNGCYPSEETIAAYRGLKSARNVARDLDAMEAAGWIKIERGERGRGHASHYDISPIVELMVKDHAAHCDRKSEAESKKPEVKAPTNAKEVAAREIQSTGKVMNDQLKTLWPSIQARLIEYDDEGIAQKVALDAGVKLPLLYPDRKKLYDGFNREIAARLLPSNPRPWKWSDAEIKAACNAIVAAELKRKSPAVASKPAAPTPQPAPAAGQPSTSIEAPAPQPATSGGRLTLSIEPPCTPTPPAQSTTSIEPAAPQPVPPIEPLLRDIYDDDRRRHTNEWVNEQLAALSSGRVSDDEEGRAEVDAVCESLTTEEKPSL